ncbi:unnamed protein product [Didymodactylos carnosus]|uniref:NAD(P)(+)--arginine ADP-ribosyltransferase n=1 Tax=Didymodactylos carnosus TaxID=1234261 RepID=A0A814DDS4_9BILA|nr:unnamed protein product [Didymodactylos carnosus]CAF3727918.1 unnamed protein product [Didymodactylos carnosus]
MGCQPTKINDTAQQSTMIKPFNTHQLETEEFQRRTGDRIQKKSVELDVDYNTEEYLRDDRFFFPQKPVKSFRDELHGNSHFIKEWMKRYPNISVQDQTEQAARGILYEAELLNQQFEGDWFSKQLQQVKDKDRTDILKCCISLYTTEGFLYKLINKTLRDNDMSKLDTLGAYCDFLYQCDASRAFSMNSYTGLVYRGAHLDSHMISNYQEAVGTEKAWDAFTSTSKNRTKAERFGNTLFIINIKNSKYVRGLDISPYSKYPTEEEVLISAARIFHIDKIDYDDTTMKHYIYLTID